MDLTDFYTGQLVTQQVMDRMLEDVENADRRIVGDHALGGVISGLTVTEHASPADLTVDVSAGLAYSPDGARLRAATFGVVDCEYDRDGIPTAVTVVGNSRILSVTMVPDRVLSEPEPDIANITVYTRRAEGYAYEVIQGAEGLTPSAPAIPAGSVLLADVTIAYGQTAILDADIDMTGRRQEVFVVDGTPFALRVGTVREAVEDLVGWANDHVNGTGDPHDAADIQYAPAPVPQWADGTFVVGTTVEDIITEVILAIASRINGDSGARRLGVEEDSSGPTTLPQQTLRDRLVTLRAAANLSYAGSGNFPDGAFLAAGSLESTIDALVAVIGSALNGSSFARKIGIEAIGNFAQGTLFSMLTALVQSATVGADGAHKVGSATRAGSPHSLATLNVGAQLGELLALINGILGGTKRQPLAIVNKNIAGDVGTGSGWIENDPGSNNTPTIKSRSLAGSTDWVWIPISNPSNGATLTAVRVATKGDSGVFPPNAGTFQVIRFAGDGAAPVAMSAVVNDAHNAGNFLSTILETTIPVTVNNVIDVANYNYAVVVNWGYGGVGTTTRLYNVELDYS